MAASMINLDPAFQGAGQKAGIEIWCIESFKPVPIPKSSYGKFFPGDSYVIMKTTVSIFGDLHQDIHYWLGKNTSEDQFIVASAKTVELYVALGGCAVLYREVQGYESEKFLSYFKPCIMPEEGRVAYAEEEKHQTRLFVCRGKHVARVKVVPLHVKSFNHDDIFILDTKSKIYQFNGFNSSVQERAKALEVVQYINDGKCEVSVIEDGKMMLDPETEEFRGLIGGDFAPFLKKRKTTSKEDKTVDSQPTKLYWVEKGRLKPIESESLKRDLLKTNKCYVLDCGLEMFVWMGRATSLDYRKSASGAPKELLKGADRSKSHLIHFIEGFETVTFQSKFDSWPQTTYVQKRPVKEPKPYIDCTGHLQVWHVNGEQKVLLSAADQSKFYSGDCYIFQYSYPGEDEEEDHLIGTWCGKQSVEEERAFAISIASKMVESMKFLPAKARIYEGNETFQFFSIFRRFIVFKGGLSDGYKNFIKEKEIPDETYQEDGVALFRVQGSGPENMQAIHVDPVASSLNSSYCYIFHSGSSVFTWSGNLTSSEDQQLVVKQLDLIKPNLQCKQIKEGAESKQFWDFLGGKSEYSSQKIGKEAESDPHLFSCTFSKGNLKVAEIYNFSQDDLMTEDIFILDCHSEIFVWVGQHVDFKNKMLALTIGENFLKHDFLLEKLSREAPIYVIMGRKEPPFFTRFFTWDSAKSTMLGNSFQRKLAIVKIGSTPIKNMTYLEYVPREVLFMKLASSKRNIIGVDIGDTSTGLCIGDVLDSNAHPVHPLVVRGVYNLSLLEQSLNKKSKGDGLYDENGWFVMNDLFSPLVLQLGMDGSYMSHILNDLAEAYGVDCLLFGFSKDPDNPNDFDKHKFIKRFIEGLEVNGLVKPKVFTFCDESKSTDIALNFIRKNYPEIKNTGNFLLDHKQISDDHYKKKGKDLFEDLRKLRRKFKDSYAAAYFTRVYLQRGRGDAMANARATKGKNDTMTRFALTLGYKVGKLQRRSRKRKRAEKGSGSRKSKARKGSGSRKSKA